MTRSVHYLRIEGHYGRWLGGLRWSDNGEAVEYDAAESEVGPTFALSGEIALFLEGFAAGGEFIHFGSVLHLLHLLGYGERSGSGRGPGSAPAPAFLRLARTFRQTGRPLRNAGALCAELCRAIPRVADPPRLSDVVHDLNQYLAGSTRPAHPPAAVAPLEPPEFEALVREALERLSDDGLRHWLRFGRGPVGGAGESVAREVPRSLGEVLAEVEERPRLRAASALVAKLTGAISLPPRRLAEAELPLGGYADVTTRGLPEQTLPGQFALDADEFLRRFAERELLYFHREEPRAPAARDVVLLVDQGVRTWGDVRLVLAAAALALGRQAARRGLGLRVATTGNGGEAVATADAGAEGLGALLEASDLAPSPAAALGVALSAGDAVPRDVVLLTHPRNLAEPAVAAAARSAANGTRLFAVAVDNSGEVVLAEMRSGAPVVIGRCRVEVVAPATVEPTTVAAAAGLTGGWRGAVEPVGFPFTLGALGPVRDHLFAFDHAGERLLIADHDGLCHAWRTDDTSAEMWPRAAFEAEVLTDVDAVLGVAGGFVVVGKAGGTAAAAHYDLHRRVCTAYALEQDRPRGLSWEYFAPIDTVVAFRDRRPVIAIDLGYERRCPIVRHLRVPRQTQRASDALATPERWSSTPVVLVEPGDTTKVPPGPDPVVAFLPAAGRVCVRGRRGDWTVSTLLADGKPVLRGARLVKARWNGGVLGLIVVRADATRRVHLFAVGDDCRSLGDHAIGPGVEDFALSADGRRVAWRVGVRQVQVRAVGAVGPPALVTPKGRTHPDLRVQIGSDFLLVQAGSHTNLIRWDRGWLEVAGTEFGSERHVAPPFVAVSPGGSNGPAGVPSVRLDPKRFFSRVSGGGRAAAVDRFGQIVVFGGSGAPVCMLHVFRNRVAAWMPDGTRVGPPELIGGPPTPHGAERIGQALRASGGAVEVSTP